MRTHTRQAADALYIKMFYYPLCGTEINGWEGSGIIRTKEEANLNVTGRGRVVCVEGRGGY